MPLEQGHHHCLTLQFYAHGAISQRSHKLRHAAMVNSGLTPVGVLRLRGARSSLAKMLLTTYDGSARYISAVLEQTSRHKKARTGRAFSILGDRAPMDLGPIAALAKLVIAGGQAGCTGRTLAQSRMPDAGAERERVHNMSPHWGIQHMRPISPIAYSYRWSDKWPTPKPCKTQE